jgi:hypothetical protein
VHFSFADHIICVAANLEAPANYHALEKQAWRLDGERLQEVRTVQCRSRGGASHLEVAGTWEDHAILYHVVGDD